MTDFIKCPFEELCKNTEITLHHAQAISSGIVPDLDNAASLEIDKKQVVERLLDTVGDIGRMCTQAKLECLECPLNPWRLDDPSELL